MPPYSISEFYKTLVEKCNKTLYNEINKTVLHFCNSGWSLGRWGAFCISMKVTYQLT
jgi:hypothetical protein